jgi:phage tail P2-like protein
MSDPTLLPPNASAGTRAIAGASARLSNVSVPLRTLWDPYTCPLELLPWLAWALSIDSWKSYWSEAIKRERVAQAIAIQRRKGTAQSVRAVVESFGGSVDLREWWQQSPAGDPHTFSLWLTLTDAIGNEASAEFVDDVIDEVRRTKPVRSHFTFTQGLNARRGIGIAAVARPAIYRRLTFEAPAA